MSDSSDESRLNLSKCVEGREWFKVRRCHPPQLDYGISMFHMAHFLHELPKTSDQNTSITFRFYRCTSDSIPSPSISLWLPYNGKLLNMGLKFPFASVRPNKLNYYNSKLNMKAYYFTRINKNHKVDGKWAATQPTKQQMNLSLAEKKKREKKTNQQTNRCSLDMMAPCK